MPHRIILSLDAMGGVNAPHSVLEGASIAVSQNPNLYFKIFGEAGVLSQIERYPALHHRHEFIESLTSISDDEQPIKALRITDSSMRMMLNSLSNGSQAAISGGNTGALMVMSKVILGEISQIKRPAIVGVMPNIKSGTVMLDLGANAECDENNLLQFALMGGCYAKIMLKKINPTIGLLNVGVEQIKGRGLEKKTYNLLQKTSLNFIGYVEGHDITNGNVDVVVTDGFSGNIVLKAAEGAAHLILSLMRSGFTGSLLAKLGGLLAKRDLKKVFSKVDPDINNGAMFIGVNGIVVKSHGNAKAAGFAVAIKAAHDLVAHNINEQLTNELESVQNVKPTLVEKIKQTSAKFLGIEQ